MNGLFSIAALAGLYNYYYFYCNSTHEQYCRNYAFFPILYSIIPLSMSISSLFYAVTFLYTLSHFKFLPVSSFTINFLVWYTDIFMNFCMVLVFFFQFVLNFKHTFAQITLANSLAFEPILRTVRCNPNALQALRSKAGGKLLYLPHS